MPTDISEKELETILVSYLRDHQGYEEGVSSDYNKEFGLDTERVKRFILSTQKEKVENTACFTSPTEEHKFFSRLSAALSKRGVTDVLRKGFKYISEIFDMYYPTPSALNPTAQQYYDKNIFCVTRQLYYSKEKTDSIDVYISLNGLPIMTMELKNHYTGQTVENAIKQYKEDRDPKADPTALILQKRRCAVHFAVDDDDIMMCTELKGNASWFLPFNKGVNGGAGNPVSPNGVRTAYLWEDVLGKRSLSDILENYAQITFKEKEVKNKKTGKKEKKTIESIIWPRYHQLDCVRQLLKATREGGVGQKFLIQHSAGSGKSNSITWLAYQLVGLLDGTTPILDTVIVVTDRVNLDTQIRDNINSFKRLSNLVDWADSSQTLKDALQDGKKIIITIVHKFPYILEAIGSELKNKHFGIIIDEAHSSQNGSLSAKMNIALSGNVAKNEDDLEDKLNDQTDEIEKYNIYTEEEVRDLNTKYWNGVEREQLDPIINKSVERFKLLDENSQIKCKSSIKGFLRYYPFIAAVTPYCSKEWEMLNTYYMLLVHKLPKLKGEDFTDGLEECIDLDQLQVTKMSERKIELENKDTEVDPMPMGTGKGGKKEPEMAKLSDILEQFNDIHWQNIEAVKVQIDSLPNRLQADQNFVNAAKNSNKETAQKQGFTSMMDIVIKMMSESTEFCRQYLDNKNFQNAINERVFQQVYSKISQGL